jgi:D-glycero-D-manno-heptose 1,7-bisphosphate phosphatase
VKLYEDVPEALRMLKKHGFRLIIITNQSGIAYGYFAEHALRLANEMLLKKFKGHGIHVDGFYYCPHHIMGNIPEYSIDCYCRKPRPGMILRAALELKIDLAGSWMVGDILHDVEAGNRATCGTILIDHGNETEWILNEIRTPTYKVRSMSEAVKKILDHEKRMRNNGNKGGQYERAIERTDK